jgi:hypothetical protein
LNYLLVGFCANGGSGRARGVNAEKWPDGAGDDEGPTVTQEESNNAPGAVEGNQDPEV